LSPPKQPISAVEQAMYIMVAHLPASWIEDHRTGRMKPKAVRLRDAIAAAIATGPPLPPTSCTCWDRPPSVPTYRSHLVHLRDCPLFGSQFPVGSVLQHATGASS
jgi:hypothetical protein